MKTWQKGVIVGVAHLLIVLSLGGKLLYDRATRPRIWVRTASLDPDLPVRGRYLTLSAEVQAPEFTPEHGNPAPKVLNPRIAPPTQYFIENVELYVENGQLIARKTDHETGNTVQWWPSVQSHAAFVLSPPMAFFISEHSETPYLKRGDELWAEVTIPRKGPPRPIQLAMKRGTEWIPLTYH